MKKYRIQLAFFSIGALIIFSLGGFTNKHIDLKKIIKPSWDTGFFTPNKIEGWDLLSDYGNITNGDSVNLELTLIQSVTQKWRTEHFVGTISNPDFIPSSIQNLQYYLLEDNIWNIRITADGKCYLSQVSGHPLIPSELEGSPYVLPIKVVYSRGE